MTTNDTDLPRRMGDLPRRLGTFRISDRDLWYMPEIMQKVMANFIVVRAEAIFATRDVQYDAMSLLFDICPEGERLPLYDIQIKGAPENLNDPEFSLDNITVSVTRREPDV